MSETWWYINAELSQQCNKSDDKEFWLSWSKHVPQSNFCFLLTLTNYILFFDGATIIVMMLVMVMLKQLLHSYINMTYKMVDGYLTRKCSSY